MVRNFLLIAIALVIFALGVLYYLFSPKPAPTPIVQTTPILEPTPTPPIEYPVSTEWKTYTSEELGFSVDYPVNMEISEAEDSVRFLFTGPTQKGETEVYDGIILSVSPGVYTEGNLSDLVASVHEQKQEDTALLEVTGVNETTVAGLPGLMFIENGLGEFTNLYLQTGEGTYLRVTYLLEDPQNLGYLGTLQSMLSSIVVL